MWTKARYSMLHMLPDYRCSTILTGTIYGGTQQSQQTPERQSKLEYAVLIAGILTAKPRVHTLCHVCSLFNTRGVEMTPFSCSAVI